MSAYASTTVPIEKSQSDLRKMLIAHGAESFNFGEYRAQGKRFAEVMFEFERYSVRMRVPHADLSRDEIHERARQRGKLNVYKSSGTVERDVMVADWEARRVWRVLFWLLKTRMEVIEEGVETFTEAFLPHLLDRQTNLTVYESLARSGGVKQLEAG